MPATKAPKASQAVPGVATVTLEAEETTKIEAKIVKLALVRYRQPGDREDTMQLAVVGDNTVHLLNSRSLGFSDLSTPQGMAAQWLSKAIFEALKG